MNLKQLQEIGFTAAEAEIYLVMLVLGKASAKQILERITTTKTTLYTVLDTFEKERLVMKEKEGKKTVYVLQHPNRLNDYMAHQKIHTLRKQTVREQAFEKIIGDVQLSYDALMGKPQVRIIEGEEGIQEVQRIIFNSKTKHLYEIGNLDYSEAPDNIKEERRIRFKKYGIKVETIYTTKLGKKLEDKIDNTLGAAFIFIDDYLIIEDMQPYSHIMIIKSQRIVDTAKCLFTITKQSIIKKEE